MKHEINLELESAFDTELVPWFKSPSTATEDQLQVFSTLKPKTALEIGFASSLVFVMKHEIPWS